MQTNSITSLLNIGRNLSDKISHKSDKHGSTFLKQEVLSTFDFQCVNCIDVKKIIHNIAAKNSCGIDAISTKLIKMIGDDTAGPLTLIINQSLSTGIFPDKLKITKVIPLYKNDDPHLVDNFDPFPFSELYLKYLKRSSLIRCMPTLPEINCSTSANTAAFASSTQRN